MPPATRTTPPPAAGRAPRPWRDLVVAVAVVAGALGACASPPAGPTTPAVAVDERTRVLGAVVTRPPPAVTATSTPQAPSASTPPPAGAPAVAATPVAVAPPATTSPPARPPVPAAPGQVAAVAGAGSVTVTFAEVAGATSYTVRLSDGTTATGPASPITMTGLVAGVGYSATVAASNDHGTGPGSGRTDPVAPVGPVTNAVPLDAGRRFVNQSTSFVSSAGTNSSRRPQATERAGTSLYSPPSAGLPAGREWQVLWLRAHNCESQPRRMEFFVVDESVPATVRKFVQDGAWTTGEANREVAVEVAAGGSLSWAPPAAAPLLLGPGQSLGARWYGMAGGAAGCNWQFAAIDQPVGAGARPPALQPARRLAGDEPSRGGGGMRTSWLTVPGNDLWAPRTVSATNCEAGGRRLEVMLLGPGAITMGALTPAGNGAGPVAVGPGDTFTWSADAHGGTRIVLPPGWSLGVRWLGMTGERLERPCAWEATVSDGPAG